MDETHLFHVRTAFNKYSYQLTRELEEQCLHELHHSE
jgi:hypothetical protein